MYVFMYVLCMYLCICVCMYVFMNICMYKVRPKSFKASVIKQIISYMDIIYFYSSKYIPPSSVRLFACSFKFFMPSRKAVFEMLSSLVTAH